MPFETNTIIIASIIMALLVIAFLAVLAYYLHRHWYYTKVILPRTKNWVYLEVMMPKDNSEDKQQERPATPDEKKLLIATMEQLYTALSDISHGNWFWQPRDYISFEIACTNRKISFYINCPKHLQELVEKQLQAQYPDAYVEEIKGYNIFPKTGQVDAAELQPVKKYYFPFRTYREMETDPLNALTNAMSKLGETDGAAIQYILYPAGNEWQAKPRQMALQIQQGRNPTQVTESAHVRIAEDLMSGMRNSAAGHQGKDDLTGISAPIHLTPMQQEMVKRFEEKSSRPGYKTNIRIVTASETNGQASLMLNSIVSSFLQYNMQPFNGFRLKNRNKNKIIKDFIFRIYRASYGRKAILNTEELASLWHLPTPFLETPNIKWLVSKKAPPPINVAKEGLRIGINTYRGVETPIYMAREDRRRHTYILGRTGSGKSYLMANMAIQDVRNGEGLCVIDPHGDLIQDILKHVPKSRAEDVILFEPFDMERPVGLNMLEVDSEEQKDFAVQEMISIFYKLVTDPAMLGPMFEHNMRNAMLTLMADKDHPGTITDIPRIFTDTDFQKYKISKLNDPVVRAFWEKEMAKTSDFHKSEMLGYLISKVGRFVENSMMRNIVGQPKSGFNFRKIMDEGKILLVNLSKGQTGEINAKLLGLIIVSKIQMAALSRANVPEDQRKDFYLYVDEFQNFITDAFASILSEARKYKLNLIIAHQYLGQLQSAAGAQGAGSQDLRDAVFGNAGTLITFRTGAEDADFLAKEYDPPFNEFDLVNIDRYNAYVKLMINGTGSKPFNMATLPLPGDHDDAVGDAIRKLSRLKFGRSKEEVEMEILEAGKVAEMMAAGPAAIEKTV